MAKTISKFLLWIGGKNSTTFVGSKKNNRAYYLTALAIFLPALIAFLSFAHLAQIKNMQGPSIFIFGVIGSFVVFAVDLLIFNSASGNKLWGTLIRVFISISLSIILSLFFLIWLYDSDILALLEKEKKDQQSKIELQMKDEIASIRQTIDQYEKKVELSKQLMIDERYGKTATSQQGFGKFFEQAKLEFQQDSSAFESAKLLYLPQIDSARASAKKAIAHLDKTNATGIQTRINAMVGMIESSKAVTAVSLLILIILVGFDCTALYFKYFGIKPDQSEEKQIEEKEKQLFLMKLDYILRSEQIEIEGRLKSAVYNQELLESIKKYMAKSEYISQIDGVFNNKYRTMSERAKIELMHLYVDYLAKINKCQAKSKYEFSDN